MGHDAGFGHTDVGIWRQVADQVWPRERPWEQLRPNLGRRRNNSRFVIHRSLTQAVGRYIASTIGTVGFGHGRRQTQPQANLDPGVEPAVSQIAAMLEHSMRIGLTRGDYG